MSSQLLYNQLCSLRLASKQLQRQSKRVEKGERAERTRIKRAIEKGDMDHVRVHAENAIRMKNEALSYLRLSSRVDAAASRVQTACGMKTVTESMLRTVRAMEAAMNGVDMLRIADVMARFESLMEDLDVKASHVDGAISQSTAALTPADEVNTLIQQVADEHNLKLVGQFGATPRASPAPNALPRSSIPAEEQDELTLRLARLSRQ